MPCRLRVGILHEGIVLRDERHDMNRFPGCWSGILTPRRLFADPFECVMATRHHAVGPHIISVDFKIKIADFWLVVDFFPHAAFRCAKFRKSRWLWCLRFLCGLLVTRSLGLSQLTNGRACDIVIIIPPFRLMGCSSSMACIEAYNCPRNNGILQA